MLSKIQTCSTVIAGLISLLLISLSLVAACDEAPSSDSDRGSIDAAADGESECYSEQCSEQDTEGAGSEDIDDDMTEQTEGDPLEGLSECIFKGVDLDRRVHFTAHEARACLEDLSCTDVFVAAHRGNRRKGAPENSLQALGDAAAEHVPFVEVDLRTTSDGVIINMHDSSLLRTTGIDAEVRDVTWADLQEVTLRTKGEGVYPIPTFEQLLSAAVELEIGLYLDIKDVEPEALVALLDEYEAFDIAIARATSRHMLSALYEADPRIWLMYNSDDVEELLAGRELVPELMLAEVSWSMSFEEVAEIREAGFHVQQDVMALADVEWAVLGSPERWFETIEAGVQVPQSDRPGEMVNALCQRQR